VRGDGLATQRRGGAAGLGGVVREAALDRVPAEPGAAPRWEQRGARVRAEFGDPGAQHGDGGLGERGDPVLAAFAVAGDVRPGAEVHVVWCEGEQFGDPQPGLGGKQQQGVVAPPRPGARVAGGQQRVDLVLGEVGDHGPVEPFGRDREDPGDAVGVLGMGQRRVAEQGVDRGESGVSGADAVAALVLEVIQEAADHRCVQLVDVQP